MTLFTWSQTASADATADPTINFAEGQAASSLNNSSRAVMAAVAKYRDDTAGAIVTGGTLTAYTVASFEGFDTLAHLSGQVIAFTPHATNGATVTLNVDSLGAKPLRSAPGVELQSGVLVQGTPYVALYNNSDGAFYLFGVGAAPGIPLAAGMDFWGATTPGSAFAFPTGQAISRTTYATLFTLMGTAYGSGDGTTTFNLPDKTGRVSAMKEAAASRLTSTYFGGDSTVLGTPGGGESQTLTASQIPSHTHSGTTGTESATHTHTGGQAGGQNAFGGTNSGSQVSWFGGSQSTGTESATHTHSITTDGGTGGGAPHRTVQPTIVCNYIIRII